jgi:DNA polymerase (family 10)
VDSVDVQIQGIFDFEVASAFYELARLLLITGANEHRANAYYHAALVLDGYEKRVWQLAKKGQLQSVRGVGRGIASRAMELLEYGSLPLLEQLRAQVPPWLLKLAEVRGVGWRTAAQIYQSGARTLDQAHDLLSPSGRARRAVQVALESVAKEPSRLAMQLAHADLIARDLLGWLSPAVSHCDMAGALRRREDVVNEIELVVHAVDERKIVERLRSFRLVRAVRRDSPHDLIGETSLDIPVRVRLAESLSDFVWKLFLLTGSRAHLASLLERSNGVQTEFQSAIRSGATPAQTRLPIVESEQQIYQAIDLPWVPPEIRHGNGELELAAHSEIAHIVQHHQVKGDLHLHTRWSDGVHSIAEMATAARNLGYGYMAVTDHSISLRIANGLGVERLLRQIGEIAELNRANPDFRILAGSEVDILPDGSLDLPDQILAQLDWVIASVHSAMQLPEHEMMRRLEKALQNPYVDAIGHPTGRLLGKPGKIFYHREPYAVNFDTLLHLCVKYGTGLEINCFPERMDLSSELAYKAAQSGVRLHLGTDAHSTGHMPLMDFGVGAARKAYLRAENLANCLSAEELLKQRRARSPKHIKTRRKTSKRLDGPFALHWENAPRDFGNFFGNYGEITSGRLKCVGIDLTASATRPSGWALLSGRNAQTALFRTDEELVNATVNCGPAVVSIDSPLSLPKGRCCEREECECRRFGIVRACERVLMKMRVGVFPALLPSMAKLTVRGIVLAQKLADAGLTVIESYPGAAQDVLGISRKGRGFDLLLDGLHSFGIELAGNTWSHDELDAVTSSLVGYFWHTGQYLGLGSPDENLLIVPRTLKFQEGAKSVVIGLAGLPAAGKTTVGEYLAFKYGFRYTRYSLLLEQLFEKRVGRRPSRAELQDFGLEIHRDLGPAELTGMLTASMSTDENWVIDGLRHLGDMETLQDRFGPRFHLVFIESPYQQRNRRVQSDSERNTVKGSEQHPVEEEVPLLSFRTSIRLVNDGSFKDLFTAVDKLLGFR